MDATLFLIYAGTFFLIIIGILLTLCLFYLLKTLRRINRATEFIDGIMDLLERLERIPLEIIERFIKKFDK